MISTNRNLVNWDFPSLAFFPSPPFILWQRLHIQVEVRQGEFDPFGPKEPSPGRRKRRLPRFDFLEAIGLLLGIFGVISFFCFQNDSFPLLRGWLTKPANLSRIECWLITEVNLAALRNHHLFSTESSNHLQCSPYRIQRWDDFLQAWCNRVIFIQIKLTVDLNHQWLDSLILLIVL